MRYRELRGSRASSIFRKELRARPGLDFVGNPDARVPKGSVSTAMQRHPRDYLSK